MIDVDAPFLEDNKNMISTLPPDEGPGVGGGGGGAPRLGQEGGVVAIDSCRVGGPCLLTQLHLRDAHYLVMPSFLLSVSGAGAKYGSGSSSRGTGLYIMLHLEYKLSIKDPPEDS